ncbi:poly(beta-D-mannuronate) lyase [Winogradskyella pacifica]|uniref:Poly(Beta-D-mannuronate) lyase n=1 Tax=Winogradskyella pacifica TaxID=664642 RepID=A0A3D9MAS9_9FLAO|nr:chondroitinase-B domain-containing protein [Winogradskyella pacifica]REE16955.1 poly(beta-D-mannuronate) lyase [Winogradskyella pacifica]
MKKYLFAISLFVLVLSCNETTKTDKVSGQLISNATELNEAIENAQPGDNIVLKNGIWKDVEIKFTGKGTKDNPITIKAETEGEVFIEGVSNLAFGGEYLEVSGLHFRNGYSPSENVIAFRLDKNTIANNCKVTNCVIVDFNKLQRDDDDLWVQFYGRHNELSNSYLAGKTNGGPTVRVDLKGVESIKNYHKIINNHFGPRPRKGGARGETIQLGSSFTSMSPSNTTIANNLFEECNGEVEIISSKTNNNIIKNNVFYKSEGSVVTRHGNYVTIDGNYFIGDGENENYGGIRIINTGHWVTNNYFFNLKGKSFRSPLAVMNGIPKSPLNRYNQVTDLVVAYNTFVNCSSPWQFGVGTNIAQVDVLPESEIRSARAIRTTVANNVVYNDKGLESIVVENDKADGVTFKNNIVDNQGVKFKDFDGGIIPASLELKKVSDNILLPTGLPSDVEPFNGFDFNTIENDLFGNSRKDSKSIGAVVGVDFTNPNILDKSKYGASWYSNEIETADAVTHTVTKAEDLQTTIDAANNGDIIAIAEGDYAILKSLVITKRLTIQSEGKTQLVFSGEANTPLFSLQPKGKLIVNNLTLKGNGSNYVFASLKENMSNHFGLTVSNTEISDFNYVLRAYKQSFSERVAFENTSISNCENGIELSEEINDRGDYNTEYLTINNCDFNNVKQNVVDYYRGGYDESTIGGNLLIANSTFTNCGAKEKNKRLLNHNGIVNVTITNNTFKNNPVQFVSILWGAKNNSASENTVINSGQIKTEENLVMTLMY